MICTNLYTKIARIVSSVFVFLDGVLFTSLGPGTLAGGLGSLAGHVEAVFGDLPELGNASEIHLGAVLERDDDVPPLADESGHHLHVLDDLVGEVAPILAGEPGDDGDAKVGEAVPEEEGPGDRRNGKGKPEEVRAPIEEDGFFPGNGGPRGGGGGGSGGGGVVDKERGDRGGGGGGSH
ncbi:unnamed protein product [Spirodela intermedia]|uniref:Uncharacterized protein n=1 Tax=Spirodela intermedia TaxID=51605 RepID=A0A7I8KDJ8_SPIIN|nr:unnamed protein product [Spirodela intermedia]